MEIPDHNFKREFPFPEYPFLKIHKDAVGMNPNPALQAYSMVPETCHPAYEPEIVVMENPEEMNIVWPDAKFTLGEAYRVDRCYVSMLKETQYIMTDDLGRAVTIRSIRGLGEIYAASEWEKLPFPDLSTML